jgi:hypothetical protein
MFSIIEIFFSVAIMFICGAFAVVIGAAVLLGEILAIFVQEFICFLFGINRNTSVTTKPRIKNTPSKPIRVELSNRQRKAIAKEVQRKVETELRREREERIGIYFF